MPAISIVPFRGMVPRTADRLLGEGAAVDATNVNITNGEIRPLRRPLIVNEPSVSGPWLAVYRAVNDDTGAQVWLAWNKDVDVVRAPLPPELEPRFYITGDGEPRFARFSDLPATFYALGVPRPQAAPTVAPSGGAGTDTTRVYVYTFYSALNEESGESPASALVTGKVDATWAISGMDAFPANSGTGTVAVAAGVTTFTNTGNHWLRVGDEVVIAGQTVAVSAVTSANVFKVPGNFTGATAWARKAPWNTAGMKRRLYRSAGSTGSYQLVHDDVGTSYNDTKTDAQILGDELISQGWEPPPPGMRGLLVLPNGAMVGFVKNQVLYSEPYQFHAWPEAYRRKLSFDIVGIGAYGTTVVACTASVPYILTGVEPAVVTPEDVNEVWPCLSKRGVVSIGDGVLYPTGYGLAYIGMSGARIWTSGFFTRTEWRPLNPASMVAVNAEGRVYVRYAAENGTKGIMVFDQDEAGLGLTYLSAAPDELYSDERNGQLYLVDEDGIKQFDAGEGFPLDFSWRSREIGLAAPVNLGAAKVDFVPEISAADLAAAQAEYDAAVLANVTAVTGYAGAGSIGGARVGRYQVDGSNIKDLPSLNAPALTFTLYADGRAVFSAKLVDNIGAFKLRHGFKAAHWAVGLTGAVRVQSVKLAETMVGLREV